jgi:membrane metallo-endopeptidase-like protein 1
LRQPKNSGDPPSLNQAKEFFSACSDINALDSVGLGPVLKLLRSYGGWPLMLEFNGNSFDWMKSLADLKRKFGTSALFDIQVNQNILQPQYSQVHVSFLLKCN